MAPAPASPMLLARKLTLVSVSLTCAGAENERAGGVLPGVKTHKHEATRTLGSTPHEGKTCSTTRTRASVQITHLERLGECGRALGADLVPLEVDARERVIDLQGE